MTEYLRKAISLVCRIQTTHASEWMEYQSLLLPQCTSDMKRQPRGWQLSSDERSVLLLSQETIFWGRDRSLKTNPRSQPRKLRASIPPGPLLVNDAQVSRYPRTSFLNTPNSLPLSQPHSPGVWLLHGLVKQVTQVPLFLFFPFHGDLQHKLFKSLVAFTEMNSWLPKAGSSTLTLATHYKPFQWPCFSSDSYQPHSTGLLPPNLCESSNFSLNMHGFSKTTPEGWPPHP